ncbi:MAG: two-component regulator propeller domain-containing protein [Bacteroidia bacterium]|nr:two-component regulator propeller domain-containing protein [Bacteroidia bacterium]
MPRIYVIFVSRSWQSASIRMLIRYMSPRQSIPYLADPKQLSRGMYGYVQILCWIGWVLPLPLAAREVPLVLSYRPAQYQAFNQNWMIGQTPDQVMCFANSAGLLLYNGAEWTCLPLAHRPMVRAVCIDREGRIFTGAYGEVGYWEKNAQGGYTYTSLIPLIAHEQIRKEEIWHMLVTDQGVWFQTFSTIYFYDYRTVEVLVPPGSVMFMYEVDGRTLFQVNGNGIFELTDAHTFQLLPGTEALRDTRVTCMLSLGAAADGFLVGTDKRGVFHYRDGQLTAWDTPVNAALAASELNKGLRLRSGRLVFGTILDGLYVLAPSGALIYHVNQQRGLQNNTVLALYEDKAGNIWAGLDKGIDQIQVQTSLTYFTDQTGALGTLYTAALHQGRLYLGTNHGIFVSQSGWPGDPPVFGLVPGSQGQAWELKVWRGRLLCGHNEGTFEVYPDRVRLCSPITGGWCLLPWPGRPDLLLQGTYTGTVLLADSGRGPGFVRRLAGFSAPVKQVALDTQGNIWAVGPIQGLYRSTPDADLTRMDHVRQYTPADGLADDYYLEMLMYQGQLWVKSDTAWRVYHPERDRFEPADQIGAIPLHKAGFKVRQGIGEDHFLIYPDKVTYIRASLRLDLPITLTPHYEQIITLDTARYLFCFTDGYAILDRQAAGAALVTDIPPLRFTWMEQITGGKATRQALAPVSQGWIDIGPAHTALRFGFYQPVYAQQPLFRYRLDGLQAYWSDWQPKAMVEFQNLPPGAYHLRVQSYLTQEEIVCSFRVLPRWYASAWAWGLYCLGIILAFAGLMVFQQRRLTLQRLRMEQERDRQLEEERMKAANERLQQDVISKSAELALSTLHLLSKNNTLYTLKEEIKELKKNHRETFPGTVYLQLLRLIEANISSEQDWKLFETNFTQINESFFKRLKHQHPDLTPGDLKLAAMLRMNLSSKDIAQLLNISLRGVENKRYRLRKKLGLDTDANLAEQMMQY